MDKILEILRNINRTFLILAYISISVWLLTSCKRANRKTVTVIVSLDGFRWDYPQMYDTPNLRRIAQQGVRAQYMEPSFPTVTFPMHYTFTTLLNRWVTR